MSTTGQPYSGKPCEEPGCNGVLECYCSKIKGASRVRYFECNKCGVYPEQNKQSIPLAHSPPRRTSFI
jgi:hypothetical protein